MANPEWRRHPSEARNAFRRMLVGVLFVATPFGVNLLFPRVLSSELSLGSLGIGGTLLLLELVNQFTNSRPGR